MKKLLFVILVAVSFLSCSKDEDPVPTTGSLKIIFTNNDKVQLYVTFNLGLRTEDVTNVPIGILKDIFYSKDTWVSSTATIIVEDLLPGCYCFDASEFHPKDYVKRNTIMIKPGKETVLELYN